MATTYEFRAENKELMDLIVNTFYSNKDVFLRELVSNASDALDKVRIRSLTDASVLSGNDKLEIHVTPNAENNTIVIEDSGIGMTHEELIANLGTIAHSGTKAFREAIEKGKEENLIGQFGVGFYSAFLVADIVDVITRSPDSDKTYKWTSDTTNFTIEEVEDNLTRGTRIVLHVKDKQKAFLEERKLRDIIKKHSSYVNYPVSLYVKKTKEVEIEEEDDEVVDIEEDTGEVKIEEVKEDEEKEAKTKTVEYQEFEQVNTVKPIWTRSPDEITSEEYNDFYKSISGDYQNAFAHKHFKVEGNFEFSALVYVPERAPYDMFQSDKHESKIKLHVKKVFITDTCEDLIPRWLNFMSGIVDSNDLPLNVSREMLQKTKIIKMIHNQLAKKSVELFQEIAEDEERYGKFYKQYSKNLKLGVHEDTKNQARLMKLLRFHTRNSGDKMVSLESYVENMKEGQDSIYYISGESLKKLSGSPFLEPFKKHGYDVLLLVDPIDEYVMNNVTEFMEKKFVCATKEGLDLGDTEKVDDTEEETKLFKYFSDVLGSRVAKVVKSHNLVDSPCMVVTGAYGQSANMQRILKSQTLGGGNPLFDMMPNSNTLELNVDHQLVKGIAERVTAGTQDNTTKDVVTLLYDTAAMASGFSIEDPQDYARLLYRTLGEKFLGENYVDAQPPVDDGDVEEIEVELPPMEAEDVGDTDITDMATHTVETEVLETPES